MKPVPCRLGSRGARRPQSPYPSFARLRAWGCALLGLVCLFAPSVGWSAACAPPPVGLVSWWQAESNAVDAIGGDNGTLLNGATYAPGMVGEAFNFNWHQ